MRAVVVREFGPPESIRIEEFPAPTPGRGEVLIDVHAAGVNFPDILTVQEVGVVEVIDQRRLPLVRCHGDQAVNIERVRRYRHGIPIAQQAGLAGGFRDAVEDRLQVIDSELAFQIGLECDPFRRNRGVEQEWVEAH